MSKAIKLYNNGGPEVLNWEDHVVVDPKANLANLLKLK